MIQLAATQFYKQLRDHLLIVRLLVRQEPVATANNSCPGESQTIERSVPQCLQGSHWEDCTTNKKSQPQDSPAPHYNGFKVRVVC